MRHSHYARVRLGGLTIWRIQCASKGVFTVLPHFILRYRRMRPDVARQTPIATHGGLSSVHMRLIRFELGSPLCYCLATFSGEPITQMERPYVGWNRSPFTRLHSGSGVHGQKGRVVGL